MFVQANIVSSASLVDGNTTRAAALVPTLKIPVIDISGYYKSSADETKRITAAVHTAATAPGFFQIVGHSVPDDVRTRLWACLREFYALPEQQRKPYTATIRLVSEVMRQWGEQELEAGVRDRKEGFMIGRDMNATEERPLRFSQGPNQWPGDDECPGFRETMMEYFAEMRKLSVVMFRIMALSLGLDEYYFDAFADSVDSISMCRAHRYPPTTCEMHSQSKGIGAHTDFGALTLLLQDQIGGLEVFHRPSQTWHSVTPIKDAFVVNIGDMMERWTNNEYTSTLHRVISPISENDRYSVAFFNEGLLDQVIECIPTCLRAGEMPRFEPVTVEEHLRERYGGSY